MQKYLLICLLTLFFEPILANNRANQYGINYASSSWNTNSRSIDSASMFIRDVKTGKLVKIGLEETAPDSSMFSGKFALPWDLGNKKSVEVYIPPSQLRTNAKEVEKFNALIISGKISPQPTSFRTIDNKVSFEIYDTIEQAARAQAVFNQELQAKMKADRAKLVKPQVDEKSLQVAKMTEQAKLIAELAEKAASRESERIRLEQLEEQRIQKIKDEQLKLSELEKNRLIAMAEQLAQRAVGHYSKSEFAQAETLFRKSTELDPGSMKNYFMYGVSLYRTEKYNEALITLKLAGDDPLTNNEKFYYIALIHYKLKELGPAKKYFNQVKMGGDNLIAPSAAFYEGLILMAEDDLVPAQAAFEFVLDNSSDVALDRKAEENIEQIAKLMAFKKLAAKKWQFNAQLGLNYDSNILYAPDTTSATDESTFDKGGLRVSLAGDAEYRFFYREKSDLGGKLAISNTQSFSTDFVQADALTATATLPYNRKGVYQKKGFKLGLTPGYETTYLDYDRSEQLSQILNTIMVNADLLLVMRQDWFSGYTIDIRSDDSLIDDYEGGDNDADALKWTIKKTETIFLDNAKKEALMAYLSFVTNDAEGIDKVYNRLEVAAFFSAPLRKYRNTTWNIGLTTYIQDYSKSSNNRKDTNTTLAIGTSKIISEKWSWSTTASYSSNTSSDESSDYSKYSLTSSANYAWGK